MIQHGWAVSYIVLPFNTVYAQAVEFENEGGDTPEFRRVLSLVCETLALNEAVTLSLVGCVLRLVGSWKLVLRYLTVDGVKTNKVVGASVRPHDPTDPPF